MLKRKARKILRTIICKIMYSGNDRYCPLCDRYFSRFLPAGVEKRRDAKCPWCGSRERDRLVWLFYQRQINLFQESLEKPFLHVAPEKMIEEKLRIVLAEKYISADLYDRRADVKMDITRIEYPDKSFSVIYCSHVLEHVQDDLMAMREFKRILDSDGWAVFMVPIAGDTTIEDPAVTDPDERLRLFGQKDHVRIYGLDFKKRLENSGFDVKQIQSKDFLSTNDINLMGITEAAGDIYYCKGAQDAKLT